MSLQHSIWRNLTPLPSYERLKHDLNTDVLIIGGGITGILCANELKRRNVDCIIAEAQTVCGGVTGNTTAKITSQHGLIYHKMLKSRGEEIAKLYFDANESAIEKYRNLSGSISCDFEEKDSYIYSEDPTKLEREMNALVNLGINAKFEKSLPFASKSAGAVKFAGQAQFSPLKLVVGLLDGIEIYEHTPIIEYDGRKYKSPHGSVKANKVIVATHFPIFNKHGAYFLKLYQHRSYVIALENAANVNGMYADNDDKGMSFRNYGDYLFIGGGGHRTGKKGGNWAELEAYAAQQWPDTKIKYRWAAQDCMSLDNVPYIGQYSSAMPDVYIASGFNKWGITSSMVAAELLADLITGRKNKYADVFAPSRRILHPQLFLNTFESAANLLTPTKPRCPHLGCALKWNKAEHSWDCPCHGSRFSKSGKLQDGPATGNLDIK